MSTRPEAEEIFHSDRRFIIGISWTSYNNLLKDDKSVYLRNLKSILDLNNTYFIDLDFLIKLNFI